MKSQIEKTTHQVNWDDEKIANFWDTVYSLSNQGQGFAECASSGIIQIAKKTNKTEWEYFGLWGR